MNRYWVKRGGDADRWGNWYVIDRTAGASAAMCEDPEMAQRIADLLNQSGRIESLKQLIVNGEPA